MRRTLQLWLNPFSSPFQPIPCLTPIHTNPTSFYHVCPLATNGLYLFPVISKHTKPCLQVILQRGDMKHTGPISHPESITWYSILYFITQFIIYSVLFRSTILLTTLMLNKLVVDNSFVFFFASISFIGRVLPMPGMSISRVVLVTIGVTAGLIGWQSGSLFAYDDGPYLDIVPVTKAFTGGSWHL